MGKGRDWPISVKYVLGTSCPGLYLSPPFSIFLAPWEIKKLFVAPSTNHGILPLMDWETWSQVGTDRTLGNYSPKTEPFFSSCSKYSFTEITKSNWSGQTRSLFSLKSYRESKNDKDVKCFGIPACYLFKVDLNWSIKTYIIGLCFLAPTPLYYFQQLFPFISL